VVAIPVAFQMDVDDEPYDVKLDIFEGPLDLLLFLIRKSEIDIYDIPIAGITRQFLEYVDIIQGLNLEQAGDFVVMAATLMKIKSRMLLPADVGDEEDEADPRDELVRRLLEYQQFKEVAFWLEERQAAYRDVFYRGASIDLNEIGDLSETRGDAYRPVSLFDLLAAFKLAIESAPKIDYHEVRRVEVSTEERVQFVLETLVRRRQVAFLEIISGAPRIVVVVTFVAILELVKSGEITARQTGEAGEIWLYKREPPASEQETPTTGDGADA